MEEKKEEVKPHNHVLEVQNGFIDVNWIFNRKAKNKSESKKEVTTDGERSS